MPKKVNLPSLTIGIPAYNEQNTLPYLLNSIFKQKIDNFNLEKILKIKLNYFAYPKGINSKKIIKYVSDAKFKAALTVNGSDINFKNKYLLDRIPMEGDLSLEQFESLLYPAGLFITKMYMRTLQTKENLQNKFKVLKKNLNINLKYYYAK